jgi:long-chain acyl-CoA synthetase
MLIQRELPERVTERNLAASFYNRSKVLSEQPCVMFKEKKQAYQTLTWREFSRFVQQLGLGLMTSGLKAQDTTAIFSQTHYLWVACDLATISNGAISVPIYPTSSQSDIEFIINNAESRFLFVQNESLLKKVVASLEKLKNLHKIVLFQLPTGYSSLEALAEKYQIPANLLTDIESLRKLGASLDTAHLKILEDRMKATPREGIATIIYTSGTTGVPKGVPLTHGNILSVLESIKPVLPITEQELYLSYLPLSHVFERICGEFYWLNSGGCCAFAEGMETMARNMQEINPSMILVVPRVLDRIYAKVKHTIETSPPNKARLINWALTQGQTVIDKLSQDQMVGPLLALKNFLGEKLVFSKLRNQIGSNLRLVVSGGAPATKETMAFFNAIGVDTLEGYGLTETSAPTNVNLIGRVKSNSVGPTVPGVEQKIAKDGEILVKGPSIFKGYYKNPQATQEAFENEWFKTGDIGEIDADGYLKITDRKKDIIVNSAGKNMAPQKIEAVIKTLSYITQAVVFGDKQKHLVALLTLDESLVCNLAKEKNWPYDSFFDLSRSPNLYNFLRKQIDKASSDLADYEHVKRFAILASELSVEAGELTATLKIKRNVVAKNYASLLEMLYAGEEPMDKAKAPVLREDSELELVPLS